MAERDPKTEWLRVQLYRRMTPQQRIEIAAQLYDDGVGIVRSSILDRNPNIAPDALQREIRRRVLPRGAAEARKPASPDRSAPARGRPQGGSKPGVPQVGGRTSGHGAPGQRGRGAKAGRPEGKPAALPKADRQGVRST